MAKESTYQDVQIALDKVSNTAEQYKDTFPQGGNIPVPLTWVNDETRLNEDNMNRLTEAVNNMGSSQTGITELLLDLLKILINKNAGWRAYLNGEPVDGTPEIFNDYHDNEAGSLYTHAEGFGTCAAGHSDMEGIGAHTEGVLTYAKGTATHAEGLGTSAVGKGAHSEGIANKTVYIGASFSDTEHQWSDNIIYLRDVSDISNFTKYNLLEFNNVCIPVLTDENGLPCVYEEQSTKQQVIYKVLLQLPHNKTASNGSPVFFVTNANTGAIGEASHSEGLNTNATGSYSHAEGSYTVASGTYAHSEGSGTQANGRGSHTEGVGTIANGNEQHVQGRYNEIDNNNTYAHIIGAGMDDGNRKNIHTVDWKGNAGYTGNVSAGKDFIAQGTALRARLLKEIADREAADNELKNSLIGNSNDEADADTIYGAKKYALDKITELLKAYILDEENDVTPDAIDKLVEIAKWIDSDGDGVSEISKAIEDLQKATYDLENVKLDISDAVGRFYKDSEGNVLGEIFNDYTNNVASGIKSHAEGVVTISSGDYSHSEGYGSTAKGLYSHAEGNNTIATAAGQHVEGRYNVEDTNEEYAHIIGNGDRPEKPSNAHTVDWQGNSWYAGDVFVGGTGRNDKSKDEAGFDVVCRVPRFYRGTVDPTTLPDFGTDGDIYIMYTEE